MLFKHPTIVLISLGIVLFLSPSLALTANDDDAFCIVKPIEDFEEGLSLSVAHEDGALTLSQSNLSSNEEQGLFQSPLKEAPRPFNAIFFSFAAKIPFDTELRFFIRAWNGERKSRWQQVEKEGEAIFEQLATAYQYRILFFSRSKRLSPSIRELSLSFEEQREAPEVEVGHPLEEEVAPPKIVERQAWGARPPNGEYAEHTVDTLIVHHTYAPSSDDYQGAATIRGIQSYHIDVRHWTDIGYHFIIGPEGKIYRGRPEEVIGAHCIPNTGKLGISIVGNYEEETLNRETRESLVQLLGFFLSNYELDDARVFGHQDFASTLCPGQNIYQQLPQILQDVLAIPGDGVGNIPTAE